MYGVFLAQHKPKSRVHKPPFRSFAVRAHRNTTTFARPLFASPYLSIQVQRASLGAAAVFDHVAVVAAVVAAAVAGRVVAIIHDLFDSPPTGNTLERKSRTAKGEGSTWGTAIHERKYTQLVPTGPPFLSAG